MTLLLMLQSHYMYVLSIDKVETDTVLRWCLRIFWPNTTYIATIIIPPVLLINQFVCISNMHKFCLGMFLLPFNGSYLCVRAFTKFMYDIKSAYPTAKIFLGGDFNSPGIIWSNSSITDLYISRLTVVSRAAK